jgi:hypothetical protein
LCRELRGGRGGKKKKNNKLGVNEEATQKRTKRPKNEKRQRKRRTVPSRSSKVCTAQEEVGGGWDIQPEEVMIGQVAMRAWWSIK